MTKLALMLSAGLALGGLGLTAASAAPAMPAPGVVAGGSPTTEVAYRRHHRHHHMHRSMRRRAPMMRSDPNARNPQQPGIAQQKGQTSGGPRY